MKRTRLHRLALYAGLLVAWAGALRGQSANSFESDNQRWRAERLAALTAPDGWLTLVGLHFLAPGTSTVGRAPCNRIVLAAGPDHLGWVRLSADGAVDFSAAPGVPVRLGQVPLAPGRPTRLRFSDEDHPDTLSVGTVSLFVIERGDLKALRVRDSQAPRRTGFRGLSYFPADPAWRIQARWVPFNPAHRIAVTNVLGQVSLEVAPGQAVFTIAGHPCALTPIIEDPGEPLFFVFADETSGRSSYASSRFLHADRPVNGRLILDFNRAFNPPCAFTPFATCPLPPRGNRLEVAVTAGERAPAGAH